MTFIISAATPNAAFQVADTRVTRASDGCLVDDRTIKMVIVHCFDAKLIFSFTGIATIRGVRTDAWVHARLMRFNAPKKVFQEIADYLRDELTNVTRLDKNLSKYGLEIPIIGLGYSPNRIRQPAIGCITNFSFPDAIRKNQFTRFDTPKAKFERYILRPTAIDEGWNQDMAFYGLYGCVGSENLLISGGLKQLRKKLRLSGDQLANRGILDFIVSLVRQHRQTPGFDRVIGEHCTAAAIMTDFSTMAVSYGPKGQKMLVPNIVR